jgi:hypothetical protein
VRKPSGNEGSRDRAPGKRYHVEPICPIVPQFERPVFA